MARTKQSAALEYSYANKDSHTQEGYTSGKWYVMKMVEYSALLYPATFASWNIRDYVRLFKPLDRLLAPNASK